MGRPRKTPLPQEPSADDTWYMFLVNYWVPFPSSEYGGLQCVIARSTEEAKQVIKEAAGDFMLESIKDSEERIQARLNKAEVYELVGTTIKMPCMIRSFET